MGKALIKGVNDLESWCKLNNKDSILKEWDYSNNNISPSEISYGSNKLVNWICAKKHQYSKSPHDRIQGGICPICSGIVFEHRDLLFNEFPELKKELAEDINSYENVKNISSMSTKKIWWSCDNGHNYEMSAANKVKSKGCPYCSNKRVLVGFNDLETWCNKNNRQAILDDWDFSKNKFTPKDVTFGSNRKVSFKCHICGNEWKTTINSRTCQNTDCKACNRRLSSSFPEQCIYWYVLKYFDDAINGDTQTLGGKELDIYIPSMNVAIEYDGHNWHKDSQKDLDKDLLCKKKGIVLIRVRETGCDCFDSNESIQYEYDYSDWCALNNIIAKILIMLGVIKTDVDILRDEYEIKEAYYKATLTHSLSADYPDVASEWHPTKNGNILPSMVTAQTHDVYYWICPICHYEYKASPHNRINVHSGCPKCGIKKRNKSQSFPVRNLDTGELFNSAQEASEKYGISKYAIAACCRNITVSSGGFHWQYAKDVLSERHVQASNKRSQGNSAKQYKVRNIDTGEIYDSLKDAQQKTHIHNISACCRGVREVAGGYHWEYVTD